jgi:hypothetical protein
MNRSLFPRKRRKVFSWGMGFLFLLQTVIPARAGIPLAALDGLPPPGVMVAVGEAYNPAIIRGLKVFPEEPFRFQFVLDRGNDVREAANLTAESERLIKYFLASLTIPEDEMWVNLSPYEKERIIPREFGQTEMGREFLAQDYLLKQIAASVLYPEGAVGKQFWAEVYSRAQAELGTTDIPLDTFNKVWIMPAKAVVFEDGDKAFVIESRLKVMLDSDYTAMAAVEGNAIAPVLTAAQVLGREVLRSIVVPILERDVNEGRNFAPLRQVYNALILATWFKQRIKSGVLAQDYVNQKRISGVTSSDTAIAQKVYQQYLTAFKAGVYNYIKEEPDPLTADVLPRKYFSGGVNMIRLDKAMTFSGSRLSLPEYGPDTAMVVDAAMTPWNGSASVVFGEMSFPKEIHPGDILENDAGVEMRVLSIDGDDITVHVKGAYAHKTEKRSLDDLLSAIESNESRVIPYRDHPEIQAGALSVLRGLEALKMEKPGVYDRVLKLLANGLGLLPVGEENYLKVIAPVGVSEEHLILQLMAQLYPNLNISAGNLNVYIAAFSTEDVNYMEAGKVLLELLNASVAVMAEPLEQEEPKEVVFLGHNREYTATLKLGEPLRLFIHDLEITFSIVFGNLRVKRTGGTPHYLISGNFLIYNKDQEKVHYTVTWNEKKQMTIRNMALDPMAIYFPQATESEPSRDLFSADFDVKPGMWIHLKQEQERWKKLSGRLAPEWNDLRSEEIEEQQERYLKALFERMQLEDPSFGLKLRTSLRNSGLSAEQATKLLGIIMHGQWDRVKTLGRDERKIMLDVLLVKAALWGDKGSSKDTLLYYLLGPDGYVPRYFERKGVSPVEVIWAEGIVEFKDIVNHETLYANTAGFEADLRLRMPDWSDLRSIVIPYRAEEHDALRFKVIIRADNSFQNIMAAFVDGLTRAFMMQTRQASLPSGRAKILGEGVVTDIVYSGLQEIDKMLSPNSLKASLATSYNDSLRRRLNDVDSLAFLFAQFIRLYEKSLIEKLNKFIYKENEQTALARRALKKWSFYLNRLMLLPSFEKKMTWLDVFSRIEPYRAVGSEAEAANDSKSSLKSAEKKAPLALAQGGKRDKAYTEGFSTPNKAIDQAQSAAPTGGIDFKPETLPLDIKSNGKGTPINVENAVGPSFGSVSGYVPVNIRISPLNSLVEFLN